MLSLLMILMLYNVGLSDGCDGVSVDVWFFPDFDGVFLFGCGALSCGWWVGTCFFHIVGDTRV